MLLFVKLDTKYTCTVLLWLEIVFPLVNLLLNGVSGTLNVWLNKTTADPQLIWTLSGNQGSNWQEAQLPIPLILSIYTLYFEGIRGPTFNGDIAIDDIDLLPTACGCK